MPAYKYVIKSDQEVAHSENHPPGLLTAVSPKSKKSIAGFRAACHYVKYRDFTWFLDVKILRKSTVSEEFQANCMKCCWNCVFPQNFHTRKLGEITAFCIVCATKRKFTKGEPSCYFSKEQKNFRNLDLAELIQEKVIWSCTELLAIAEEQRTVGQIKIAEFAIKGNKKYFVNLLLKLEKWSQSKKN